VRGREKRERGRVKKVARDRERQKNRERKTEKDRETGRKRESIRERNAVEICSREMRGKNSSPFA
jgi:hypothetical protein